MLLVYDAQCPECDAYCRALERRGSHPGLELVDARAPSSVMEEITRRGLDIAEGIALDGNGQVSEGSGMNIFLVHDGVLITPPLAASILPGITRDSIVKLAEDLKVPVEQSVIPREMLYLADEVFFVGTAVEVTPIRSIDKITIGKGVAGPVTRRIQEEFFAVTSGRKPDTHNWLTPVNAPVEASR